MLSDGAPFVIYERNATLPYAAAYTRLADLDRVAWDLILERSHLDGFCKFFMDVPSNLRYADRRERRMAEFLVRDLVPLHRVRRIGVVDDAAAFRVTGILRAQGVALPVEVRPEWYFLPGQ